MYLTKIILILSLFTLAVNQITEFSQTQRLSLLDQLNFTILDTQQSPIQFIIYIFETQIIIIQQNNQFNTFRKCKFATKDFNLYLETDNRSYMFNRTYCSPDIKTIQLKRVFSIGIEWIFSMETQNGFILTYRSNQKNQFAISTILLILSLITAIILPYQRKYISEISIKMTFISLTVNLQTLQIIVFMAFSNAINILESNQITIFQFSLLIILIPSFLCILAYEFVFTVSLWKLLNRYNIGNKKILKFFSAFLIISTIILFPFYIGFVNKNQYYYAYCYMSIIAQLLWCNYAGTSIPFRYLGQSMLTIWALICINFLNPSLNFDMVSKRCLKTLIIYGGICVLYSAFLWIWFRKNISREKPKQDKKQYKVDKEDKLYKVDEINLQQSQKTQSFRQPNKQQSEKDLIIHQFG